MSLTAFPVYAAEYQVSITGLDGNPGTETQPFRTISAAASGAGPGDTITVHAGVYRERVNPPRGGNSDKIRISVQTEYQKSAAGWVQRARYPAFSLPW